MLIRGWALRDTVIVSTGDVSGSWIWIFQQLYRGEKSLVADLLQFAYYLAHWISSLNSENF